MENDAVIKAFAHQLLYTSNMVWRQVRTGLDYNATMADIHNDLIFRHRILFPLFPLFTLVALQVRSFVGRHRPLLACA